MPDEKGSRGGWTPPEPSKPAPMRRATTEWRGIAADGRRLAVKGLFSRYPDGFEKFGGSDSPLDVKSTSASELVTDRPDECMAIPCVPIAEAGRAGMPGDRGVEIPLQSNDVLVPLAPDDAPRARMTFLLAAEDLPGNGLRLTFAQGETGAASVELSPPVVDALEAFLSRRRRTRGS